jgi:glutathione S-transferase
MLQIANNRFRLYGTIGSPYALKLRAQLRYQRIPFDWVPASLDWLPPASDRPMASEKARREIAHIRPAVIPVVYFPGDTSYRNDSTLVACALDGHAAGRSIVPADPGVALLAHLLEDMADEWGVKIAFQYRWGNNADSNFKSRIVTGELLGGGFGAQVQEEAARHFAARQIGRMPLVGCTPHNAPLILETFRQLLDIAAASFEQDTFLFGPRPTLADFGWYGQLESLATDPTSRAEIAARAPGVFTYLQILEDASGVEATWPATFYPLSAPLKEFLALAGAVYLPFLHANAEAISGGSSDFSFSAYGHRYTQQTFKYQAKCLAWLRDEFAALPTDARARVTPALRESGCLPFLDVAGKSDA